MFNGSSLVATLNWQKWFRMSLKKSLTRRTIYRSSRVGHPVICFALRFAKRTSGSPKPYSGSRTINKPTLTLSDIRMRDWSSQSQFLSKSALCCSSSAITSWFLISVIIQAANTIKRLTPKWTNNLQTLHSVVCCACKTAPAALRAAI